MSGLKPADLETDNLELLKNLSTAGFFSLSCSYIHDWKLGMLLTFLSLRVLSHYPVNQALKESYCFKKKVLPKLASIVLPWILAISTTKMLQNL